MSEAPLSPAGNVPEYSVSEIADAVKLTLESSFGRVRVRGEVTELRRYASGHIYLSLKDEGGKLAAVIWRSAASRLDLRLENGLAVIAQGRLTAYGERSTYQLIVEQMEYAGAGALLARIEALRQKLLAEGLFDAAAKRRVPMLPRVVGVVTSENGAVIQDIRITILRRFPRPILLWPVAVQGEGAAGQIAAAIRGFDALPAEGPLPRPDVLIVARGGGSLEDLMAFNDEEVVRAAATCRIPLISAVGHETDTTLIDLAADCRAPTPTAAAEMAVPSRVELVADLAQKAARLLGAAHRLAQECRLRLQSAARGLPDPATLIGMARQRLDDRAARMALALPNLLTTRKSALLSLDRHARSTAQIIASQRGALALPAQRLHAAFERGVGQRRAAAARITSRLAPFLLRTILQKATARLAETAGRLEAVSPDAVLQRGFVLVFDAHGAAVTRAAAVRPGTTLRLRFADGSVPVTTSRHRAVPAQQTLLL